MPANTFSTKLPNGLPIQHVSQQDLQFLYTEIFEEQCYLQHGVQLRPGDTVVDVGSNIGLFSLAAAEAVGEQGLVLSVEPVPRLQQAQRANIAAHKAWCASRGVTPAEIRLLELGAGDGSVQEAQFTLYTEAAGWSTMKADDSEVESNMGVFLKRSLATRAGISASWLARAAAWLQALTLSLVESSNWNTAIRQRLAPAWLFDVAWRWHVRRMLRAKEVVTCRISTVSDILAAHSIRQVDLLKIDVERAELDVLCGIAASDWQKIKQVSMEAHDLNGQLQAVSKILRETAGFHSCVVDQSGMLSGSSLYNVYCTRT